VTRLNKLVKGRFWVAVFAVLITLLFVFAFLYSSWQLFGNRLSQASTLQQITLYPSQVVQLSVYYDNSNKVSDFNSQAQIKITLDERLSYMQGYLKDSYSGSTNCINDAIGSGIVSSQNIDGKNLTIINYTPKTASVSAPTGQCVNGNGNLGNTVNTLLPKALENFSSSDYNTWRGRVDFRIKLKENVLTDPYNMNLGDIININPAAGNYGIQTDFSLAGKNFGSTQVSILIGGNELNVETNISNGQCINEPVIITNIATCRFAVTGDARSIYIYPNDFRAQISGASTSVDRIGCAVVNASFLECKLPTNGLQAGTFGVLIRTKGITLQKATVRLTTAFSPQGDDDRDGIFNGFECGNNEGTNCIDTDGDGIPDYLDTDSDNDGIPDFIERECTSGVGSGNPCNTDGDGIPDFRDVDSDGDGVLDSDEKGEFSCNFGVFPPTCQGELKDSEGSGIPDFRNAKVGANPLAFTNLLSPENLTFGTTSGRLAMYGQESLSLTTKHIQDITNCEVNFRSFGSKDEWKKLTSKAEGKLCIATLQNQDQKTNLQEFLVVITDKDGVKWGAMSTFRMEIGGYGITQISLIDNSSKS
jgi:hypothetical protein